MTQNDDPFADLSHLADQINPVQGSLGGELTGPPIRPALPVAAQPLPRASAVTPYKHDVGSTIINVGSLAQLLYFRQSMLHDYLVCPQMMAYRWIMGVQQEQAQFFSAFLGTAGHEVIYLIHHERKFDYSYLELMELFEIAFNKAVMASPVPPKLSKGFSSVKEEFMAKHDEYLVMIDGYMRDIRNQRVYPVMQEQPFVLEVESDISGQLVKYLFTGVIDLGIFHENGKFGLRDFKFKINQLKPNKTALDLDCQFTLYALAVARGNPACDACRPRYEGGELCSIPEGLPGHVEKHIVYEGPCSECVKKIEGKRWPRMFPNPCEMVWMRDYLRHEKDEYEMYTMDKTKPKVKGPKGGLMYQRVLNPDYAKGYKRGDYKGKCLYPTFRDPALLNTLLADILRMADSIRRGEIYRRPGEQCAFWCKFRDPCLAEIKVQVNEKHLMESSAFASEGLED